MKRRKRLKEKYELYSLRRKGTPGNVTVELHLVIKELKV